MEIGLIFLAMILATLIGWLLKQSFNTQPWVPEPVEESDDPEGDHDRDAHGDVLEQRHPAPPRARV